MNTRVKRSIEDSWKVQLQEKSNIHSAGFILPAGHWKRFDPFLIMAEDVFQTKAFGVHPHRGIETVTYVIDGTLNHKDNKGGKGSLHTGDAQWMTAGSGISHIEAPPEGNTVHTLQLWVNLPKVNKMTTPRYQDIRRKNTPMHIENGVVYRLYSGSSVGLASPTKNHAAVTMIEIEIEKGATASPDFPVNYNGFIYVLEGSGAFGENEEIADKETVLLLDPAKDDRNLSEVNIKAKENLRILLYAGKPIKEAVVAQGPFVMNTQEEIQEAYADYKAGKF